MVVECYATAIRYWADVGTAFFVGVFVALVAVTAYYGGPPRGPRG